MNLGGRANLLGTWFDFNVKNGVMWADVSLIKGCDGSVTFANLDGQGIHKGFANDVFPNAPNAAFQQRPDGQWDLDFTEALGNFLPNMLLSTMSLVLWV